MKRLALILVSIFLGVLALRAVTRDMSEDSIRNAVRALYDSSASAQSKAFSYLKDVSSNEMMPSDYRLVAYAAISEYYIYKGQYDSSKTFLENGYSIWKSTESFDALGCGNPVNKLCNGLALYAMICETNYEKSVKFLIEGLEMAKSCGDKDDYIIMGSNLIWADLLRNDTTGLGYALDIYEYSKHTEDAFVKYSGAYNVALMMYLKKDYVSAEKYLLESLGYADVNTNSGINAYCTYADILSETDRLEQAEDYFGHAYRNRDKLSVVSALYLSVKYSSFLARIGKFALAEEVALEGLRISEMKRNRMFLPQLYRNLSQIYAGTGNWRGAYDANVSYKRYDDTVFNIRREYAVNELNVKYETARREEQIQRNRVQILRRDKALYVSALSILLITTVLAVILIQYRSRNRMYRMIVRQYNDAMAKEDRLDSEIKRLRNELASVQAADVAGSLPPGGGIASDKSAEIFSRIEDAMKTSKVYREQNLTRERLAEIVGTNRTYLTKVINDNTGNSFSQYLYSYRLREAIHILSSPEMEVPLKAVYLHVGFSSNNTFYKLFKDEVGMTPAQYRENALKLSEN